MTRSVQVYTPAGSPISYPTLAAAERAARSDAWSPIADWSPEITSADYDLPAGVAWDGDLIEVELHRGGHESSEGIHSGGGWSSYVGLAKVGTVNTASGTVHGSLRELGTDALVQSLDLQEGVAGFPFRNLRVLRAGTGGAA